MSKINFLMTVHNGGHFVKKSIESVLRQSEKDISLYVRNNGSTDNSSKIIREFEHDPRIVILENKENYKTDDGYTAWDREWWPEFDGEYVAIIDHDDILDSDFASEMYQAAKENSADLAVCGCIFFDDKSGGKLRERISPALAIQDMSLLEPVFEEMYGNLRTQWGILYRTDFFEQYYLYVRQVPEDLTLCRDTWYVLKYLQQCQSFVSVDKPLYWYRVSSSSQYHAQKLKISRIAEADILYECGLQCVRKLGIDSSRSQSTLYGVHLWHMIDLLGVLSKSKSMDTDEKLEYIQEILKCERIYSYLEENNEGAFKILFDSICNCIFVILSDLESLPITLWSWYIYRIYDSYTKRKQDEKGLSYAVLLGALFDKENPYHFGCQLLHEDGYSNLSDAELHFRSLQSRQQKECLQDFPTFTNQLNAALDSAVIENMQNDLNSAVQNSEFDRAAEVLEELSGYNAIDEHALYYRLYLSCLIEETDFAHRLSFTAHSLWSESAEINDLCTYIESLPYQEQKRVSFKQNYLNIAPETFDDFEELIRMIRKYTIQSLVNLSYAKYCRDNRNAEMQQGGCSFDDSAALQYTKQVSIGCFLTMEQGGATVYDAIKDMKRNVNSYQETYVHLSDQKSKDTLRDIMLFRFYGDLAFLKRCSTEEGQYYLPELLPKRQDAVYVDCGTFNGKTVLEYISVYGQDYRNIYAYEPMPNNYNIVRDTLNETANVQVFNRCVSSKPGNMKFTSCLPDAANRLNANGDISVTVGTLDLDILEKITFIKMDIEGAEQEAIKGAAYHIKQDCPELAICVYHLVEDLWKIPQMIYNLNANQKFHLRYHLSGDIPEEMVFYASPDRANEKCPSIKVVRNGEKSARK